MAPRFPRHLLGPPHGCARPVDSIQGLGCISLQVTDGSKAREFYTDVLGLKEEAYDERASSSPSCSPTTSAS